MPTETPPARVIAIEGWDLLALGAAAASAGAHIWVTVRGSSMAPAIVRGSEIRVGPRPERPLRCGDVVLARSATGAPVVHRIWRLAGGQVWLKGDFRLRPDLPIPATDIVGLVDAVSTGGGVRPIAVRPSMALREVVRRLHAAALDYLAHA